MARLSIHDLPGRVRYAVRSRLVSVRALNLFDDLLRVAVAANFDCII
jgi:hypothetical protein